MKNTVFPHKFWRPFLDCMPQLFFRPQYVWFPVHLKGHLIPLCYETLVVNWQNWLFTLFHQSRSVLSPNPIDRERKGWESIKCWTHVVAWNFDLTHHLDLGFSRWNIEMAVSQEWEGQMTWNERYVSWIWCWMYNGIDPGPQCMANKSAK